MMNKRHLFPMGRGEKVVFDTEEWSYVVHSWVGQMVLKVGKGSLSGDNGLDEESEPAQESTLSLL